MFCFNDFLRASFTKELAHTNKQQTYIATLLQTTLQHYATLQNEDNWDPPFMMPHSLNMYTMKYNFAFLP
jgi:hypothetical protein